ncbi:hypothetical protein D3C78_1636750 [compost metagenome]
MAVDVGAIATHLVTAIACIFIRLIQAKQWGDDQVFVRSPFGVHIQFTAIEVQCVVLVQRLEVEEQGADSHRVDGFDLQGNMLD